MNISIFGTTFEHPAKKEPEWAQFVERWYQLDAFAYGLAHGYKELKLTSAPHFLILASPGGSNETDFHFVKNGASSPSKFVHTLPSVRGAPLLQLMEWKGEVLCFQNDPYTWLNGLEEGLNLAKQTHKMIWVVQVRRLINEQYRAQFAVIDLPSEKKLSTAQTPLIARENQIENTSYFEKTDHDFWKWLERDKASFRLSPDWEVQKL